MIFVSKLPNQEKRKILYKFSEKIIHIKEFIDETYRIGGDPQYNTIVCVRDNWGWNEVYNRKLSSKGTTYMNETEAYTLQEFGNKTGQYYKSVNFYNHFDFSFNFKVTSQLIEAFYKDE